jgi:predicted glycosyltransferase
MVAFTGPRLDPAALGDRPGLETRGYVPDPHRHLAACDVALVQGGLTTCMELVAAGRPFVAAPLARHFEQRRHVRHRLERHGHRAVVEAGTATPEALAGAIAAALADGADYAPVPDDGAARAAALIAELL